MIKPLILCIVLLTSCLSSVKDAPSQLQAFEISESNYQHLINNKDIPDEPNLNIDKTVLNRDYPIEVALYRDGNWYYDLPNLGTGKGTWRFVDGELKLHAERSLFDMNITIFATKEGAQELAMKFFDRHGFNKLSLEKINQEL